MSEPFKRLIQIMSDLRNPDSGCPWDLEQTHNSLKGALLEETYELLDALDFAGNLEIIEELGDLLLQVIFHAQIGSDNEAFDINDVIQNLNEKLIRRHPHVFGENHVKTSKEVVGQWEKVKAAERAEKGEGKKSMLAGISTSMPALAYAYAAIARARRAGFDWEKPEDAYFKVLEEVQEFENAVYTQDKEAEFGDILLSLVGVAYQKGIDPEQALRSANNRFFSRFSKIEDGAREHNLTIAELTMEQKLALWQEAKNSEERVK